MHGPRLCCFLDFAVFHFPVLWRVVFLVPRPLICRPFSFSHFRFSPNLAFFFLDAVLVLRCWTRLHPSAYQFGGFIRTVLFRPPGFSADSLPLPGAVPVCPSLDCRVRSSFPRRPFHLPSLPVNHPLASAYCHLATDLQTTFPWVRVWAEGLANAARLFSALLLAGPGHSFNFRRQACSLSLFVSPWAPYFVFLMGLGHEPRLCYAAPWINFVVYGELRGQRLRTIVLTIRFRSAFLRA